MLRLIQTINYSRTFLKLDLCERLFSCFNTRQVFKNNLRLVLLRKSHSVEDKSDAYSISEDVQRDLVFYMKSQLNFVSGFMDYGATDSFLKKLNECLSVHDVFSAVENTTLELNGNHACCAILKLASLKYKFFHHQMNNFHSTYLQANQEFLFRIRDVVKDYPTFNTLLLLIMQDIESLKIEECTALLLCLNEYSLTMEEEVMQKLHIKVLKSIDRVDLISALNLSFLFSKRRLDGYFTMAPLVNRIGKKLQNYSSVKDFKNLAIFFINCIHLNNPKVAEEFFLLVNNALRNDDDFDVASLILLNIAYSLMLKVNHNRSIFLKLVSKLVNHIPKFSMEEIIVLYPYFHFFNEPREASHLMRKRAIELLSGCQNDITNIQLVCCVASFTSFKFRSLLKTVRYDLLPSMMTQRFWGLYIIIQAFDNTKEFHDELLAFLLKSYKNTSKEAISLSWNIYLLKNYMQIVSNSKIPANEEAQACLVSALLDAFKRSSIQTWKGILLASYLLSFSPFLQEDVFHYITNRISNLSVADISRLSNGIRMNYHLINANNASILRKLNSLLDGHTAVLLKDASLTIGTLLANCYLIRKGSSYSLLFDNLMSHHESRISELDAYNILSLTRILRKSSYYSPKILQGISDYVVENKDFILYHIALNAVLQTLFDAGCHPLNISEVVSVCSQLMEEDFDQLECIFAVLGAIWLGFYKGLTPRIIHSIFNASFLNELGEDAIGINQNDVLRIRNSLITLNRMVCIDYPEEMIPWFHEHICPKDSLQEEPFCQDVEEALTGLLGGSKFVGICTRAPYGYILDFEVTLNKHGIPITYKDAEHQPAKTTPDFIRLSFLIRDKSSYSMNNETLKGDAQLERRHLEMLGYVVVEVPHFLWHSRAVRTSGDKKELLKSLILKELSHAFSLRES